MLLYIVIYLCIFPFTILALGALQGSNSRALDNIAKPNCETHCGNVIVPYPFGIGNDTGCSIDNSFHVTCNMSSDPPKLFLRSSTIEIYNISDSEIRIPTSVAYKCYNQNGTIANEYDWWIGLSTFTFSQKNMLTVLGCDDYSFIRGTNGKDFSGVCSGVCSKIQDVSENGQCSGMGCCQTSIPKGIDYYNITLNSFQNHTGVHPFNQCGYAFLGEEGGFMFHGARDLYESTVRVVVDWVIAPKGSCTDESDECKENSSCYGVDGGGYRCRCNDGFEGNPYLDPGCQDIDECKDPETNPCHGDCINIPGSYNCTCPLGSLGDAKIKNGCQGHKGSKFSSAIFIIATVFGLLAMISGILGVFYCTRRKKLMKLREKFFEKNGGVLLKQKIKSQGSHEAMTLFSIAQLRKATHNYSKENIIGRELVTGKKPIGVDSSNGDNNLATYFVNSVTENRLYGIVEPRILREGTLEQIQAVGDLVKRCLNLQGRDRPTMKEVVVELDTLRKFTTQPWIQQQTFHDTRSSVVLEVEQSDLYEVPLVSYDKESYLRSTHMAFEENKPR
ncbi:hypothetical protein SSX86_021928 [Deinandra increscens subsp. villosa]|uniref:EGF-like domain-containing protein n=1 Tax=Deinandra increscens subsp. villosa TaxID=3103831 RepID=A0AAP0GT26_9ASTR